MFVFDNGGIEQPQFIVNFPTKKHWRSRARLDDIRAGLEDLVSVVTDLGIKSVAVPPLGCGNGGLSWRDVEPLIREAFRSLRDVEVLVYPPAGAPVESAMPVGSERPAMTSGKAVLVALTAAYVEAAGVFLGVSQLELQKTHVLPAGRWRGPAPEVRARSLRPVCGEPQPCTRASRGPISCAATATEAARSMSPELLRLCRARLMRPPCSSLDAPTRQTESAKCSTS